jgi:bifunctional non-homologous end joining protein LigD
MPQTLGWRRAMVKISGEVVQVAGKKVLLTNLDKPLWIKEGITKGDVIEYYAAVAPQMLKFLRDRPLMLNRFPHGIGVGKPFVQKDWPHHPPWVQTVNVQAHGQVKKVVRHVVCNDEATLVWLADMACLEINQFLSSGPDYEKHDLLLIDLDPHAPAGFAEAVEIGLTVQSALDHMHLRYLLKTSGHDGLHFLVPIVPKYDIELIRRFVYLLGVLIEGLLPKIATTSRKENQRVGKVYIDYYQNGLFRTIAAPYSLRPTPGAPASFPLKPATLKKKRIDPAQFNIRTVPDLVRKGRVVEFDFANRQRLEPAFKELGVNPESSLPVE